MCIDTVLAEFASTVRHRALIGLTICSQNTTDATSAVAFANLKEALPTWREVLEAPEGLAEQAVRCGGLADVKMARVRTILNRILDEHPQQCEAGNEICFMFDF